jgi:hypothetical protein
VVDRVEPAERGEEPDVGLGDGAAEGEPPALSKV